jgi:hypothetical protein
VRHPLRRSASERSAKGRSATRSDSQRLHGRTRWDGHPAWESTLGPLFALPNGDQPNGGKEREERRRKLRLQPVHVWDGRDSESCAAVPVFCTSESRVAKSEAVASSPLLATRDSLSDRLKFRQKLRLLWSGLNPSPRILALRRSVRLVPSARLHVEDEERILDTFARH